MEKQEISARTLVDFLGVPRSTLSTWLKSGILGEKFLEYSQGAALSFSMEDAVGANIAKIIFDIFKDSSIARKAVKQFKDHWESGKLQEMPHMDIHIFKEGVFIGWSIPGVYKPSKSNIHSTTVICVDQIIEDVRNLFTDTTDSQLSL